jgi:hypothetical protein
VRASSGARSGREIKYGPSFEMLAMWPVSKPMVLRRSRPKRIPRSGCAKRELVVTRFAQDFEAVLSVHIKRWEILGSVSPQTE